MSKSEYTPINVSNIQNSFSQLKVKTLSKSAFKLKMDKSNVILFLAILFFLASISFWGYVNFYLDGGG